jgi:PhoPQ-activated pathogenicity-related protein
MKSFHFLFFFFQIYFSFQTPLEDYVNTPDSHYQYSLKGTINAVSYTSYVIQMTSQKWLTNSDSDRSIWNHWLTICVPKIIQQTDISILFIDGGSNNENAPTEMDPLIQQMCMTSQTVVSYLRQIPNQPITFTKDPSHQKRTEDDIIAYTWAHFLNNTHEPYWLLRLPMTKAVVRAMDTIQSFVSTSPYIPKINKFVVSGASKRGWTTWTSAIVDKRVIAIIPIVIPILNIVPNINRQYQAYGEWSFALDPYLKMHNMKYLNKPEFVELAKIVDPYSYLDRLHLPKYIICATGDEFFLPDSTDFFFDDLPGEKYLRMVPNAEHSLLGQQMDIVASALTFYQRIVRGEPRPKFSYSLKKSNITASITLTTFDKPTSVYLWYTKTISNTKRDFRLIICGDLKNSSCYQPATWFYKKVEDNGNGKYIVEMQRPLEGWRAFFLELYYKYSYDNNPFSPEQTFKITTEVNIVPDYLPFLPCGDHCQIQ